MLQETEEEKQAAQVIADLEQDEGAHELAKNESIGVERTRRYCIVPDRNALQVYMCRLSKNCK